MAREASFDPIWVAVSLSCDPEPPMHLCQDGRGNILGCVVLSPDRTWEVGGFADENQAKVALGYLHDDGYGDAEVYRREAGDWGVRGFTTLDDAKAALVSLVAPPDRDGEGPRP